MIIKKENSYTNEEESVSVGNRALYKLCEDYPMNDSVNGLIAKLWIIGRSYAASPERRNYGKSYADTDAKDAKEKKIKLNLNTGSNGTDSFFMALSKKIIGYSEYNNLIEKIDSLKNKRYEYKIEAESDLLKDSIKIVLLFNKILRKCIEEVDAPNLEVYECKTGKNSRDRDLRYFISFSSKFMHFHLPNLVYIIDSFSFAHARKRNGRRKDSEYIYKDNQGNLFFTIDNSDVHYFNIDGYENEKEQNYIDHVVRCHAIMCKLHEKYNCQITPRMLDNFVMRVNTDVAPDNDTE